jgi:predicted peroxiredoxin
MCLSLAPKELPMSKILVHIVTGPENSTRSALGFLVARTAAAAGHDVTLFLAGDGVAYLRDATMDAAAGIGTGSVREHYAALAEAGARLYASGMSSKARGIDAAAAGDKAVEFVPPDRLVELILEADRVVTY